MPDPKPVSKEAARKERARLMPVLESLKVELLTEHEYCFSHDGTGDDQQIVDDLYALAKERHMAVPKGLTANDILNPERMTVQRMAELLGAKP